MIKYLELTAPESLQLKGAKILKTEVSEGDTVKAGDTLFTIVNDGKEVPLPSTLTGKVIELIARDGDGVSMLTPLLLLETEVASSQATSDSKNSTAAPAKDKNIVTVKVPDIGTDKAKVVEILVKEGDQIGIDDPVATLESDKASMEVPSTVIGTVQSIKVTLDTDVAQGDALIEVKRSGSGAKSPAASVQPKQSDSQTTEQFPAEQSPAEQSPAEQSTSEQRNTITIPDIGDGSAKVVEILVNVGDKVSVDDPLVTLESDKASMEVPNTVEGTIEEILIALDQDVSQGDAIVVIRSLGQAKATSNAQPKTQSTPPKAVESVSSNSDQTQPAKSANTSTNLAPDTRAHASPSVRRFARELGAQLSRVKGTGRKGRITHEDVKAFVKSALQNAAQGSGNSATSGGSGIPKITNPDFTKFGAIEYQDLNRIKQLTATNLHRSWVNVPHVTHNDEANIANLESFRKQTNEEYKRRSKNIKLSPLAFIVKAVVNALQNYPQFNSSLSEDGKQLILKKYFNVGIAVDTPDGLVVPVIKNADTKSVAEIATEMGELAGKARDKKLTMADMSGACFTISSLGGIGGTGFTPIVNAPEVAILGVSRTKIQPHWNGKEFEPAPFLPLSLSYDHRVIDGAEAARFTRHIADVLEDLRRLTI